MATFQLIASRLKSVQNIQKITKSMKMVSASKYSRAERELKDAKPYGKGTQIFFEKIDISTTDFRKQSAEREHKLIMAISSDKGLCGSVHAQVSKAIKAELVNSSDLTKIICIGDKSRVLLQYLYSKNIVLVANEIGRLPSNFLDASRIALYISKYDFTVGKIVYNKFNSVVSYSVAQLPLVKGHDVLNTSKSLVYDSLESDILDSYLEFSLASLIFYTLKENSCSEQASRMTAMDNATKNAGDMISKLTLSYNRTRQSMITRELIEIISGAAALK